jgi:hypothetical protein
MVPHVALNATETPLAEVEFAEAVVLTEVVAPEARAMELGVTLPPSARPDKDTLVAETPKSKLAVTVPAVAFAVAAPTVAALTGLMLTEAMPLESVSAVVEDKITALALVVMEKLTKVLGMTTPADVAYWALSR